MATHSKHPNVFSPIRAGPVELPNRYYFSPHGLPLTVGCGPSTDLVAHCTERVKDGGCGLVILSCTAHSRGRGYQLCPYPPETVPAFQAIGSPSRPPPCRWRHHWRSTNTEG